MLKLNEAKKNLFLIVFISVCYISSAQKNYVTGYVIRGDKDTLHGLIDYRNWQNNPTQVHFKSQMDAKPVSFHPMDIIEFGTEGEIYTSAIVETEVTPLSVNKLDEGAALRIKKDTAFLQVLFRGNKELYYYNNKDGRENLYIMHNNKLVLLKYKKYLEDQNGKDVIMEYNEYVQQLSLYLDDCETIQSILSNTGYNRKNLYTLFQYYYKCTSSVPGFRRKQAKPFMEIGVVAGGSITSLKFKSKVFSKFVQTDYSISINPSVGIGFDLVFPKNQRKWSFNNEILYTSYSVTGKYTDYTNENNYTISTTEFAYRYLKLNTMIRYKHAVGNVFLFLNAGISNGMGISETNRNTEYKKFYTTESVEETDALEVTRKYEQGILLGAGARYNRYSFEFRGERGNGMSMNAALTSTTTRFHFLVGYKFR